MNRNHLKILVPGFFAAAALAFGVGAATPPAPAAKAAPKADHAKHDADMKAECKTMMAKHEEMRAKQAAMDVTLDKLVVDMNAAKTSKEAGALERSMAAVLNELVGQRKSNRLMMAEMQPSMMAHQMHHMDMDGAMGEMECPMMKEMAPPAKVSELKPKP